MLPVGARTAPGGVHGTGPAHHNHRHPVAPGVEHGHAGVLQPDDVMGDRRHRFTGGLGIAMGHGHGVLFVTAENNLRLFVAPVIHDRIVNPAKRGSGIKGGIFNVKGPHQIDNHIGTVFRLLLLSPF